MIYPPVVFLIFLIVAVLLGLGGMRMAPREPSDKDSTTSYAGGEDIQGKKSFPGYELFYPLALFFTILHILALLLGLMPLGVEMTGLFFAGLICFALLAIILK